MSEIPMGQTGRPKLPDSIIPQGQTKRPRPTARGITSFTKWKQKAVDMLLEDDELMKLMIYNTPDWRSKPIPTREMRESLVDNQIYKYRYIDEIAKEQKSYISMGMSNYVPLEEYRLFSEVYLQGYFYFFILCDADILNTNNGVRSDLILDRVYSIFEGTDFGIGDIAMESMIEMWVDNGSHGGYSLGFKTVDMR